MSYFLLKCDFGNVTHSHNKQEAMAYMYRMYGNKTVNNDINEDVNIAMLCKELIDARDGILVIPSSSRSDILDELDFNICTS